MMTEISVECRLAQLRLRGGYWARMGALRCYLTGGMRLEALKVWTGGMEGFKMLKCCSAEGHGSRVRAAPSAAHPLISYNDVPRLLSPISSR